MSVKATTIVSMAPLSMSDFSSFSVMRAILTSGWLDSVARKAS
jgi:hypothetical protein